VERQRIRILKSSGKFISAYFLVEGGYSGQEENHTMSKKEWVCVA
jgi:hypothetical protein